MSDGLHPAAAEGFAAAATRYESGRPGYPPEALSWLVDELSLGTGRRVLDLAAGTGKLTRALVATGSDVVAVEPVSPMRAVLAGHVPAAEAIDGTAEAIPLPDAAVDAVTVAQAFHWFDAERAVAEIHRVLRPGGRLAVVFNVRDETVPWQARLTQMLHPLEGDAPRHRHGTWRATLDAAEGFARARERSFVYRPDTSPELVLDRVASMSFVAAAEPAERARVLDEVRRLLATDPETAGRARFPFPYRTDCLVLDRVAARSSPDPD